MTICLLFPPPFAALTLPAQQEVGENTLSLNNRNNIGRWSSNTAFGYVPNISTSASPQTDSFTPTHQSTDIRAHASLPTSSFSGAEMTETNAAPTREERTTRKQHKLFFSSSEPGRVSTKKTHTRVRLLPQVYCTNAHTQTNCTPHTHTQQGLYLLIPSLELVERAKEEEKKSCLFRGRRRRRILETNNGGREILPVDVRILPSARARPTRVVCVYCRCKKCWCLESKKTISRERRKEKGILLRSGSTHTYIGKEQQSLAAQCEREEDEEERGIKRGTAL